MLKGISSDHWANWFGNSYHVCSFSLFFFFPPAPMWMLVSAVLRGKMWKTLKYPFNHLYLRPLSKGLLTSFSVEQPNGPLSCGMKNERHYFGGKNHLIYLREEAYFLVPFESMWSHVCLLFKLLVWFDFLLFLLLCGGEKCIFFFFFFWGKENVIPFVFHNIVYCFYKVQPGDGFISLRWSAICVSCSQSFA